MIETGASISLKNVTILEVILAIPSSEVIQTLQIWWYLTSGDLIQKLHPVVFHFR